MGRFVKGDVVVTRFPYSNLRASKKRPALVVASLEGKDVILCQITSQSIRDKYAVSIEENDFYTGASNARPNRLFTADSSMFLYRAGALSTAKIDQITDAIIEILRS